MRFPGEPPSRSVETTARSPDTVGTHGTGNYDGAEGHVTLLVATDPTSGLRQNVDGAYFKHSHDQPRPVPGGGGGRPPPRPQSPSTSNFRVPPAHRFHQYKLRLLYFRMQKLTPYSLKFIKKILEEHASMQTLLGRWRASHTHPARIQDSEGGFRTGI